MARDIDDDTYFGGGLPDSFYEDEAHEEPELDEEGIMLDQLLKWRNMGWMTEEELDAIRDILDI